MGRSAAIRLSRRSDRARRRVCARGTGAAPPVDAVQPRQGKPSAGPPALTCAHDMGNTRPAFAKNACEREDARAVEKGRTNPRRRLLRVTERHPPYRLVVGAAARATAPSGIARTSAETVRSQRRTAETSRDRMLDSAGPLDCGLRTPESRQMKRTIWARTSGRLGVRDGQAPGKAVFTRESGGYVYCGGATPPPLRPHARLSRRPSSHHLASRPQRIARSLARRRCRHSEARLTAAHMVDLGVYPLHPALPLPLRAGRATNAPKIRNVAA